MLKRKILTNTLGVLTLGSAFFAWLSVHSAIVVPDSSTWAVPMVLFSTYLVLVCLDIIVFRNMLALELVLLTSLSLSLVFASFGLQLVAVLLGAYLLFLSSRAIRRNMELTIKISPMKSLQSGKTYLLFAFCVLISMQYFITIKSFDGEKKVPHFDASFITRKIAIPFLSSVNPQFKSLKDETLTVDQFILQTQNANQNDVFSSLDDNMLDAQLPENLTPAQKEMIKAQARENFSNTQSQVSQKNQELVLSIGRKQLADTIGVPVDGSEKISDVFTGLINNKINDYFNPKVVDGTKSSVFSMILAIVLFLIIYPVGLILLMFVFLIAQIIISVMLKSEVLSIKTETVLKEVLE